jgi:hypothetical protein
MPEFYLTTALHSEKRSLIFITASMIRKKELKYLELKHPDTKRE